MSNFGSPPGRSAKKENNHNYQHLAQGKMVFLNDSAQLLQLARARGSVKYDVNYRDVRVCKVTDCFGLGNITVWVMRKLTIIDQCFDRSSVCKDGIGEMGERMFQLYFRSVLFN